MFFTNSMSSFGARAPCSSSFFVSSCNQCTSSSAESVVGSIVLVEIEVAVHRVEIRVGRERAEVAECAQLTHRVAARRADEQHQERHALGSRRAGR